MSDNSADWNQWNGDLENNQAEWHDWSAQNSLDKAEWSAWDGDEAGAVAYADDAMNEVEAATTSREAAAEYYSAAENKL